MAEQMELTNTTMELAEVKTTKVEQKVTVEPVELETTRMDLGQ